MENSKLRFLMYHGAWSVTKLSEISKKVTRKNSKMEYRITLTNSAENGIINQLDYFDHEVSNRNNIKGYYVVEDDDFVYNPRISVTAPVGPINRNTLGYTGVMSPLYYVFKVYGVNKDYLQWFFKTSCWHKYLKDNGNSGARFDRLSITDDLFCGMPISLPDDTLEQKDIAEYFNSIENLILSSSKKVESLKQLKQASLVSMFPQQGETKPRVRFKGFTEEWDVRKLEDCLDISKECNLNGMYNETDVLSVSDDYGVVNQIELLGRSYAGKSVTNYGVLHTGEIVYTKSPLKSKPYGIIKVNRYRTGIVSVLYAIYKPKEGVSSDFIQFYFDPSWRLNNYLRPLVNKGAKNTMNISDEMALTGMIAIPKTIDEQRQIAQFFATLDNQISLETQRLEKLKQIKSACLDKMFV